MLVIVLSSVGIDPAGIALIFAVDRILDMFRTVVNVTGDATIATIINSKRSNEDLIFSTKSLIPFAHWITHKKMPKRFDTRFYIAEAPKDHEGEHDGTESVDSIWISPQQALDDCYSKKRTIIFPTRLNLEKLSQSNTVEK